MKKFKFLVLPVATFASVYLMGLSLVSGLDKQIVNECSINPEYDYCIMYAESQNNEQNDQAVLIASVK